MTEQNEKLKSLDSKKLMDVVKNYKQYGYDVELRQNAIMILQERGISEDELKLLGQLENTQYEDAERIYKEYKKVSNWTFVFYLIALFSNIFFPMLDRLSGVVGTFVLITSWLSMLIYFILLIISFIKQGQVYDSIGKTSEREGPILYLLVGMPLYLFVYFYFNKQLKLQMKRIR